MTKSVQPGRRQAGLDVVRTVAIFGTVMIHATAVGGFSWPMGSLDWTANLAWSTLLRCAVPLFLMCSGALFLGPERDLPLSVLWKKYILRIVVAMVFWAAAYLVWNALLYETLDGPALRRILTDLVTFRHRTHLYYLQIMVLVYGALPITRLLVEKAGPALGVYGMSLWLVCGSLLPLLFQVGPFSRLDPSVQRFGLSFTWMALGYGVLGYVIHRYGSRVRPGVYGLLFLGGFLLTFLGTWFLSVRQGQLSDILLQGSSPGVVLEGAGLFGLCAHTDPKGLAARVIGSLSRASFCIYLVHLFFLDCLVLAGWSTGTLAPLWYAPAETLVLVLCGFVTWLILRRIPWVNRYLI